MASPQQTEFDLNQPPSVERIFLGWHEPLLPLAVRYLARDWQGGVLDLSDQIVVVPTRNASRRLREALALHAAERDSGVLPPILLNPDDLLVPRDPEFPLASQAESLIAWVEVLRTIEPTDFPALFPKEIPAQSFSWALHTARQFQQVQSLLGEAAHHASYAAKVLGEHDLEPERWQELAHLEQLTHRHLLQQNRLPRQQARRLALENPALPPQGKSLLLLGLPDPPPALETLLENLAAKLPLAVAIHAPEEKAALFTRWGLPHEDWLQGPLDLPEEALQQARHPAEQAGKAAALVSEHPEPHLVAAVGVPDPEVLAPLQEELAQRGLASFDPAGTPLSRQGICHLLRLWREFLGQPALSTFRELLRVPGVAAAAGSFEVPEGSTPFPASQVLRAFDDFHEAHLCESLDDAWAVLPYDQRKFGAVIGRALSWAQFHLRNGERQPLGESLPSLLADIYAHTDLPADEGFATTAQLCQEVLQELQELPLAGISASESFQLYQTLLEQQTIPDARPDHALDLPGWLELPWEDAPHLVLTGCNEGSLPESVQGHPWLPNRARILLGLRHNAHREARDRHLLTSLLAARQATGRVDLLFGRTTSQGDPLRPSRLLLATSAEDLPARVNLLFRESDNAPQPLPWTLGWQLTPPAPGDPPATLSVTSFASYLACPFRYYLKHQLRMQRPDLDRSELNARDFGTFTHHILEKFADSSAASSESAKEIAECFDDLVSQQLVETYGERLSAPLILQANSIRQRLRWWAHLEARQRAGGWRILTTEAPLAPADHPFQLEGMTLKGYIDRIEEHPEEGLRILDFKTKKKPTPVIKAHLRNLKRSETLSDFPAWQQLKEGKREQVWSNLQIPLYLLALRDRYPKRPRTAGYVQLGATKGDVHLDLWESLDHEVLDAAEDCARGVARAIREQIFWPPTQRVEHDDFEELLFAKPTEAVQPTTLSATRPVHPTASPAHD
ncbi:PD-(D/E)XK nuclease family protein [Roseibacillus ishigakijimensis]|uniref:PD-(D/E)XK nuclease family protein n=1 Tax=Roseibacillus ishigakijimensis TaxID=454146 RepID=UPI001F2DAA3F|nr:PD-(D/E)XK nuclease family protein [Roseibacillus ishigakijimensis]